MKFICDFEYSPASHLGQIIKGLKMLEKEGVVKCSIKHNLNERHGAILYVRINDKYNVVFDELDGFNWIKGTKEENLNHFKNNIKADFYFKRSFTKELLEYAPEACKVYPLGLNYFVKDGYFNKGLKRTIKDFLKEIKPLRLLLGWSKESFDYKFFEHTSTPNAETKILFLARLWDPSGIESPVLKKEREQINQSRIDCIRACKETFGNKFTGGISADAYSKKVCPDILAPFSLTNKENYITQVQNHNICIATGGLHNSTGWKFGEYVASSRAIITEPLYYEVPGEFKEDKNYLTFSTPKTLVSQIQYLLESPNTMQKMMTNNKDYYEEYVRPDILVKNALDIIKKEIE